MYIYSRRNIKYDSQLHYKTHMDKIHYHILEIINTKFREIHFKYIIHNIMKNKILNITSQVCDIHTHWRCYYSNL